MALTSGGRLSILNHVESVFTKVRIHGSWDKGLDYGLGWYADTVAAGNGVAATYVGTGSNYTITWDSPMVFTIDLSATKTVRDQNLENPFSNNNFTKVTIYEVSLLAANDTVLLTRQFPSPGPYVYLGNGTFTLNSLSIVLT